MTEADTKSRILDAAEHLFAQDGFRSASLRAITARAEVNVASVNYHFGSKASLVHAILERKVRPVNEERLRRLQGFADIGRKPSLEELLDVFYRPAMHMALSDPHGAARAMRLYGRIHGEGDASLRATFLGLFREVAGRFQGELARLLPDLSPAERDWRFHMLIALMVQTMQAFTHEAPDCALPGHVAETPDEDTMTARLVGFAAAGLRAPAASAGAAS